MNTEDFSVPKKYFDFVVQCYNLHWKLKQDKFGRKKDHCKNY